MAGSTSLAKTSPEGGEEDDDVSLLLLGYPGLKPGETRGFAGMGALLEPPPLRTLFSGFACGEEASPLSVDVAPGF